MTPVRRLSILVVIALFAVPAFAQTTSQLTGTVTSQGSPVPGVTVTITAPTLQGSRTAVTGETGDYQFAGLPPGEYTVVFELSGMEKVTRKARLQLSQTARADADLRLTGVAEAITVTAAAPSVLETPQVASNMTLSEVEALPVARNQVATALLAPGVTGNTLSANQFQISGSPGYDNLVMVNGVVVTENVRSQVRPLYVEDAIQETTILTGSISAEYGRFTGGVVNTITKSGGNEFSGSLRDSLSNAAWAAATPANEARPSKLNHTYEGTLGGFIVRDRLWFFGAGRMAKTDTPAQTIAIPASPISSASPLQNFSVGNDEKRYELKLTGQVTPKHNLVGAYLDVDSKDINNRFQTAIYDLASLNDRSNPESLMSVQYNGVITNNLLIEGQYSKRKQAFVGSGSKFTDIIQGTLLIDRTNNARFNSPTFCGVCDTETRNNGGYAAKANYFLSTRSVGTHNIVGGFDRFEEQRYANNFQSGSNFRLFVTSTRFANGTIYPVITPTTATGGNSYIRWTPIFVDANESNVRTDSLFVNDKWDFNAKLSFNVGLRYDKNDAVDGVGNVSSKDSKISPRLGVFYDLRGDGRHRLSASYGEYVSRIVEGIAASNNTAGAPGTI
ncbi:MAG TPA: TonB-dependent receptor, partial [Thermoanaerobaculia bacterium]